jgi:hypothetical protein
VDTQALDVNDGFWPILLKVRQVKPGGVGSHVKENTAENF